MLDSINLHKFCHWCLQQRYHFDPTPMLSNSVLEVPGRDFKIITGSARAWSSGEIKSQELVMDLVIIGTTSGNSWIMNGRVLCQTQMGNVVSNSISADAFTPMGNLNCPGLRKLLMELKLAGLIDGAYV